MSSSAGQPLVPETLGFGSLGYVCYEKEKREKIDTRDNEQFLILLSCTLKIYFSCLLFLINKEFIFGVGKIRKHQQ